MKKIFVSRALSDDSPLLKVGTDTEVCDQSLLLFSSKSFEVPEADWVFFYSRNGVKYFFEAGPYELYPFKWACMSGGTAEELSQYVQDISFIGDGNPASTADSFRSLIQENETVAYIRAEHSINSIYEILGRPQDNSVSVYNNTANKDIPMEDFDVLIFTSPMNADAFFSARKPQNEDVIAIGNTTASKLKELKIPNIHISATPSEQGIADVLSELLKPSKK